MKDQLHILFALIEPNQRLHSYLLLVRLYIRQAFVAVDDGKSHLIKLSAKFLVRIISGQGSRQ